MFDSLSSDLKILYDVLFIIIGLVIIGKLGYDICKAIGKKRTKD